MWDIVLKIWLCLAIAAILGGIIGWLLRSLSCRKKCDEYEGFLSNRDSEIAKLRASAGAASTAAVATGGGANLQAEIDSLKAKLSECDSEKTYLLGQVKKAETGESIKREVPMDQRDDLELINGVGPVLERMLYDMGIYFFKDIAGWDAAKIAEINEKLPNFHGRIEREGWVESAKEEHFKKYGERL